MLNGLFMNMSCWTTWVQGIMPSVVHSMATMIECHARVTWSMLVRFGVSWRWIGFYPERINCLYAWKLLVELRHAVATIEIYNFPSAAYSPLGNDSTHT